MISKRYKNKGYWVTTGEQVETPHQFFCQKTLLELNGLYDRSMEKNRFQMEG